MTNFLDRHGVVSRVLHGDASSVDLTTIMSWMQDIGNVCESEDTSCTLNVDETVLYLRLLPRRTCLVLGENWKTVRGVKEMRASDRLTAWICSNVDGTARMPIHLIGTAAKLRFFRAQKPSIPSYRQKICGATNASFGNGSTTSLS